MSLMGLMTRHSAIAAVAQAHYGVDLLSDRRPPEVGEDTTPNLNHAPGERWDQSRGPRCLG
jgi:hypothetical protein